MADETYPAVFPLFLVGIGLALGLGVAARRHFSCKGCRDSEVDDIAVLSHDPETTNGTVDRFLKSMARQKPQSCTTQQLQKYTRNYSHKLGSGGFGVVYKGRLPDGIPVAVKVLNDSMAKPVEEQFMAEVNSIGRTYHINLVKLYGYCFDPNLKALVYEFMPNGSLDKFLFRKIDDLTLDWDKLHNIAVGTAKGIAYLHEECEQKIIHHDIKPGNVLLDSNLNPKVADFGLARLSNRDSSHVVMSGFKGTPGYAAPEVWTSYVTHKCDVYSFGMLLFEIVGRRRNHVRDLSGTSKEWFPRWSYEKVTKNEVDEMLSECGVEEEEEREKAERAVMVALWCVQYCPAARPEMGVVVKMLEGGIEIVLPPNPFGYLEQTFELIRHGEYSTTITSNMQESDDCGEDEISNKNATYPQVLERRINVDQHWSR